MLVTRFSYLLAIIKSKTCGSTITRKHRNTLLTIKVKLKIKLKVEENFIPLHKDCKYQKCGDKNNN